MKNYFKKFIYFSTVALLLASCDQKEDIDYTAKVYDKVAGDLTVQLQSPTVNPVTNLPDINTTFDADFNSSKDGIVYYAMDLSSAATPSASSLVYGSTGLLVDSKLTLTSGVSSAISFKNDNIYGGYEYAVFSVMASEDGYLSEVKKTVFTTPDTANPVFLKAESSPAFQSADISPFAPVTFNFSEPVFYQGGDITFTAFDSGSGSGRAITVNDASAISMSGTSVTVNTHGTFEQDDFIIVTWADGTFKDNSGKSAAASAGFNHYFSTRAFTVPEMAFLMQGTWNYSTVFYGALSGFYTANASFFLADVGQIELKLDPSDPTGSTLLGVNIFSPLNQLGSPTEPDNLKIRLGDDGELIPLDAKQPSGINGGGVFEWTHWSFFGNPFPGFYDFDAGTINHWLQLVSATSGAAVDDIDYNYTRVGTFAKNTQQSVKNLEKRNELLEKKVSQNKTYEKVEIKF